MMRGFIKNGGLMDCEQTVKNGIEKGLSQLKTQEKKQ